MFEKVLKVDPGANTLKLWDPREEKMIQERSLIAFWQGRQYLGEEAFPLFWEKGSSILRHPIEQGLLTSDITPLFLKAATQAHLEKYILKPSLRVLMPKEADPKQKEMWKQAAEKAGFWRVFFTDPIDVLKVDTGLVIHCGSSYTHMAAFRNGTLLEEKKIIFAGRQMDEAIMEYVAKTYRSLMFYEDAAQIKEAASNAFWKNKNPILSCTVLDQHNQFVRLSIKASELWPAMKSVMDQIVLWSRELLSQIGLENMEAILTKPVRLTGGMANCYGLRQLLEQQLNAKVSVPDHPTSWLIQNTR